VFGVYSFHLSRVRHFYKYLKFELILSQSLPLSFMANVNLFVFLELTCSIGIGLGIQCETNDGRGIESMASKLSSTLCFPEESNEQQEVSQIRSTNECGRTCMTRNRNAC